MDRSDVITGTRIAGGVALGALLMYGGVALEQADWGAGAAWFAIIVTLAGTVIAVGALARLGVTRAAGLAAFALLGVLPVAAALGWWLVGDATGLVAGLHVVNLLAGMATAILSGWLVAQGASARSDRRVAV